jgi:acetoin utilization protein AcuB
MTAEQIMSDVVPPLKPVDYCNTALSWMEVFRISHLPVVENNRCIGIISDNMIYDANIFEEPVKKLESKFLNAYAQPHMHFYELIDIFIRHRLTALPVVKSNNVFLGLITLPTVVQTFAELFATDMPGGVVILEMHTNDYSLSEIAQIIEGNDARILSCYVSNIPESMRIRVTLKVNKSDLTSILRTFERYDYEVNASFVPDDKMNTVIQDRFDAFMQYLDI